VQIRRSGNEAPEEDREELELLVCLVHEVPSQFAHPTLWPFDVLHLELNPFAKKQLPKSGDGLV
jgi:hypothetical protein